VFGRGARQGDARSWWSCRGFFPGDHARRRGGHDFARTTAPERRSRANAPWMRPILVGARDRLPHGPRVWARRCRWQRGMRPDAVWMSSAHRRPSGGRLFIDIWEAHSLKRQAPWSRPQRIFEGYVGSINGMAQLENGRSSCRLRTGWATA